LDYLVYSYLQKMNDTAALQLVVEVMKTNKIAQPLVHGSVYSLLASIGRYWVERKQWKEAAEFEFPLVLQNELKKENGGLCCGQWAYIMKHYIRILGLAHMLDENGIQKQDEATLHRAEEELEQMRKHFNDPLFDKEMRNELCILWRISSEVHLDVAEACVAWLRGQSTKALELLSKAAQKEDSYFKPSVKPSVIYIVREHLAERFLQLNRYNDALIHLKRVQTQAPNRLNVLLGAGLCAERLDAQEEAYDFFLLAITQVTDCSPGKEGVNFEKCVESKLQLLSSPQLSQSIGQDRSVRLDKLANAWAFVKHRHNVKNQYINPSTSYLILELWIFVIYLLCSGMLGFGLSQFIQLSRKKEQ